MPFRFISISSNKTALAALFIDIFSQNNFPERSVFGKKSSRYFKANNGRPHGATSQVLLNPLVAMQFHMLLHRGTLKKQILYSAAGVCARRTQFDTRGLECQAKDRPAGLLFQTCWFQFVCWSRRCGPCSSCIVARNQTPCGFGQHVCEKEATAIWEGNQWVWFFLRGIAKGFDYSAADVLLDQKRRQLMLHIIYLRPG